MMHRQARGVPRADEFSPELLAELEERTFANQVDFHRAELIKINKGSAPRSVLTSLEARGLVKRGLLIRGGRQWELSPRARAHLDQR
jgi:hypothetical protein